VPALNDDEPFVYNINNYRGGYSYELESINIPLEPIKYYTKTWKDVTKSIYDSSLGVELRKSGNFYKEDLQGVIQGASTVEHKIASIFNLVKTKVKWNGYNSVFPNETLKKVYQEGSGNVASINLILISMLQNAGIDAYPVIGSTRGHGIPVFPTRRGFNYTLCAIKHNESYILMDASDLYSLPNNLPSRIRNWQGRIISKDGESRWINLNKGGQSLNDSFISVKIDEEGVVEGMMQNKYNNLSGIDKRRHFFKYKEDKIISEIEEDLQVEIQKYKVSNQDNLSKPFIRSISFSSEDLLEEINGKMYLSPLLFYAQTVNPFKLDQRKFPVEFTSAWKNKYSISIKIPEGYKVESVPESAAVGLPDKLGVFKYKLMHDTSSNTVRVIASVEINKSVIPAGYYETLKLFYSSVVKKQSEKIVLVKA